MALAGGSEPKVKAQKLWVQPEVVRPAVGWAARQVRWCDSLRSRSASQRVEAAPPNLGLSPNLGFRSLLLSGFSPVKLVDRRLVGWLVDWLVCRPVGRAANYVPPGPPGRGPAGGMRAPPRGYAVAGTRWATRWGARRGRAGRHRGRAGRHRGRGARRGRGRVEVGRLAVAAAVHVLRAPPPVPPTPASPIIPAWSPQRGPTFYMPAREAVNIFRGKTCTVSHRSLRVPSST